MIPKNAILIGTGALTWDGVERRTDRYGTVTVHDSNADNEPITNNSHLKFDLIEQLKGKSGQLIAEILETRKSTHIGDMFRRIYPSTPDKGDIIELGDGRLFVRSYSWANCIGLEPNDGRLKDWLDPVALYRCHEQTVNIYFVPNN